MPQWLSDVISVAPWLGAIIVAAFVIWKAWPVAQKVGHLVDDLFGEVARPGVPARPGIVESVAILTAEVAKVKAQVQNSHLTNLRDDVDLVLSEVSGLHKKMDENLTQTPPPTTTINVNGHS